ncbi:beta strand repeat-containing protein, partial [Dyella japonica]
MTSLLATLGLTLFCAGVTPAAAATQNWDINGNTAGLGGTGMWDTASAFWNSSATGTGGTVSAWNNANLDDAVFAGTAGTVTLGAPITAHNLTFGTTGYTLTGNTLTLGGATPTVTTNTGVSTTISSVLAGAAGLTKAGAGTLTLSGANTFSGGVNVTGGILSVNGNGALGDVSNGIVMANGTQLNVTPNFLAAARVVTLTSGSVTLTGRGAGSARFTGAGGLVVQSQVNLTNNANNYTGQTQFGGPGGSYSFSSIADLGVTSALGAPTTVANGTVVVVPTSGIATVNYTGTGSSSNRNWVWQFPAAGAVTLTSAGSGSLTLTGNITMAGTGNQNATFNATGANLALLGVISDATTLENVTFSGSAGRSITLGGANTWQGVVNVSGATVLAPVLANLGSASSFGTAAGSTGSINVLSGGTVSYIGTGASTNRIWTINNGTLSNAGSGALSVSGAMTITGTATLGGSFNGAANNASGVISGVGTLTVNSAGTWVLTGTNTYTGGTAINAGVLQILNDANLGNAAGGLSFNGGTLQTAAALTTNRTTTLNAGEGTVDTNGFDVTFGGQASGVGALTKAGTGTLILSQANTYAGGTTISGGTLQIGNNNFTGSIVGDVIDNGTLAFARTNFITFSGVISGAGDVRKSSGGTLILSGDNSYFGGTELDAGTLQVQHDHALGSGDLAMEAGTTLDFGGTHTLTNAITLTGSSTINVDTGLTGTLQGVSADGATTGALTKVGAGTLILGADNTYTGGTTISAGALQLGNGGTSGSIVGDVTDNGALAFDRSDTSSFGGLISGSGVVNQIGAGTTVLMGVNTYTGGTAINAGTLQVSDDANLGDATGGLSFDGGTLQTTAALTTNRATTLNAGGGIVDTNGFDVTFGGVTSGVGGLTKAGAGTLTLTGNNTYTGLTTISAGALQLGNGGTTGSIASDVADNGALVFNRSDALSYGGAISGAGTIAQIGSGITTLG